MILAPVAVHHTADPSFECPKCHWTGVASLKSFVVIVASRAVQPKLGDGDAMDRRIKLPITVFGRRIRPAVRPDQCGTGAKPACCANAASPEKRVTSAVSPMIFAAVTAPHPGIP